MAVGRFGHTLTTVGDHFVAAGGLTGGLTRGRTYYLSSVEIHAPGRGWATANRSHRNGAYCHCLVKLSDSEIMIVSGDRARFREKIR